MLQILIADKDTGQFKYIKFKTFTNVHNPVQTVKEAYRKQWHLKISNCYKKKKVTYKKNIL